MAVSRKLLVLLALAVLVVALFADRIVSFYIDLLWFDKYELLPVIWTILGAQMGFGLLAGGVFFLVTFTILRTSYQKSSHIPVNLADHIRQNIPVLELMATNLKPLVLFFPLFISVLVGLIAADQWETILKFLNQVPFNQADPVFGKDYSFYLFSLPFYSMIKSIIWTGLVLVTLGLGVIYFFKQYVYLGPKGFGTTPHARRTISLLAGIGFLLFSMEIYLRRYGLMLNGNSSVVAGLSYADDHGRLPLLNLLMILCLVAAAVSLLNVARENLRRVFLAGLGIGVVYAATNLYPGILKRFVVDPNELIKETPYIEHTIAGTVLGYGLDEVESNDLTGSNSLEAETIAKNKVTIDNIRLWDQNPLLDTLGQIQEIRTYYEFQSVHNDRYTINGKYQQTLLSPRELRSDSLPNRTWINEHLTFTHGYGVSLSPVNQVTPEGLPLLYIKDIPPQSSIDLQVTRPEIYYGELTEDHVFVNTNTKEFDYPEGEKNVYKNYEGTGGVQVSSFLRKVLLAARFKTTKILFSQDIHNDSRVLLYRNITERVRKVAPFLELDRDPYLIINDTGRLVWMYDAYTVSDQFPYSERVSAGSLGQINYIRNSVKITIDAYDGTMVFYVTDSNDPIIGTYQKLFPTMFKDIEAMPQDIRKHTRYPQDMFGIQTFIYSIYHMKTPQVFYNKEDQWEIPKIDERIMLPYYTIMKLPEKSREEYILMLPYTPRGKQNLSAWMVARSDGEHYGKLVVYKFPKQKLIYGPAQMVARINQEAEISRQISLWDQRGSQVIQGNMLVIPIEESLIYVRPLYLKADAGKIPELKRVIVGYLDQIAMEPTLDEALLKIFPGLKQDGLPAAAKPEATRKDRLKSQGAGRVVLRESDYLKIKQYFERTVKSQTLLENAVSNYKEDLEDLGKALDSATVLKEEKPAKASVAPTGEEPALP